MKFLAEFIMRGRMSAMMVASTLALISLILPPVSIVSSATVALVTLRRGAYEGLYVLISSSVAAALLGFLVLGGYQFALLYGLVLWIPIWLISIVLREGRHLSLAVEIAVLLGAAAVLLFYGVQEDPARLWESVLVQIAKPMMDANPDVPMESVQQSLKTFARFMTGIIAAGAVYGMLFGLFLGRWWQATLYNPGGFRQEFLALSTHPRLAIGSVLVVLAAWWTRGVLSEAAWNVSILFFVLYTFIGSAVLHNLLARTKISHFLVPMMYVTLLLIPHVMLPVAVLGLLDTWLNLRNKFLVIEPK
ncbi:DUF2232 domain-containing protein [Methylicorpusculum sp.]|uniref:DUF2232 domain-containing protein n=1 Tax=Methylicorpusculum sp. TaxID=2713644 RepID=UPI00272FE6A1|nr:DUF2232 domain-containing protein [Methylicorpusculum sp.]MDP2177056.1 DUF2232 domain-containing protein [Methylicorpusculum sp.]MDP3531048.1 DUF2232 domain-containing protein [Methylicorpusculum sp.]MDZ4154705.1 DUF2232 domain-containing protein [Methylicorpusculum sp.]